MRQQVVSRASLMAETGWHRVHFDGLGVFWQIDGRYRWRDSRKVAGSPLTSRIMCNLDAKTTFLADLYEHS